MVINDSILVESEFEDAGFCGGRKPDNREKNSRSKTRTNNNLSPHMTSVLIRTWATLVRRERFHHHPSPAPHAEVIHWIKEPCSAETYLLHSVIVYKTYRHAQYKQTPENYAFLPGVHFVIC